MNIRCTIKLSKLVLALLLAGNGFAQRNSEKGDRYFDQNVFDAAIKCYQADARSRDHKVSDYAMRRLADCYRITGEFEKSEEICKKIVKRKKKDAVNYLNYGLALKNSAKYAEAKVQFEEYIALKPEDPMGKVFLLSCDSAQVWLDETIGKEAKNLEKINTPLSEFSPVLLNNKLFFSSSRPGSTKALISFDGGGEIHRLDLYNIDVNDLEDQAKKKSIVNFKEINTPLHEGSACFSADGSEIYFTKTVKGKRDKETNAILGTLQVFYSKKDSAGKWSVPVSAFAFNSPDYSVGQPSLSKDGSTIFYMSDKPGGHGKTDIYYSVKRDNGSWGPPINAGNEVNTFGYELFPSISAAGELYFSSNAHPGMGQLDIFKASLSEGKWGNVHNLKPPFNSIANDFGIVFEDQNARGFFSSDRFNGKGAEDIYSFSEDVPLELTYTNGSLLFEDKSVFDDIKYQITNLADSSQNKLLPVNGSYTTKLAYNCGYELVARKNSLPYNKISIRLVKDSSDQMPHLELRTSEKNVRAKGYLPVPDPLRAEGGLHVNASAALPTGTEGFFEILTDEEGCFTSEILMEPGKHYSIRVTSIRKS